MLRTPFVRSRACLFAPISRPAIAQWQLNRPRFFAERHDRIILPGTRSATAEEPVPIPPSISPIEPTVASPIPEDNIPKTPPTPETVGAVTPSPETGAATPSSPTTTNKAAAVPSSSATGVPTGTGTASVAPSSAAPLPPPPPKRKTHRFRNFLTTLFILSSLSYAGGVYYSLENDNFHDFFTEYIPFGEDAVGYFEEREFRKRFPSREIQQKNYPQIRGENKVTIGKASGLSPRLAKEEKASDLGQKGRHVSAVDDNKPAVQASQTVPGNATQKENSRAVEQAKKDAPSSNDAKAAPKPSPPKTESKPEPKSDSTPAPAPASPASLVDHVAVPNATEPVVQDVVKMLNDIITVINGDPNNSKYETTISQAKSQLSAIISDIGTLKAQAQSEAGDKITNAHKEFDTAAKELVSRLEKEMQTQEMHWREEYETEREKLSDSYNAKLSAELDVVRKVAEQRTRSALVEQEISLHRQFATDVSSRVESERNGRLSKLNELSSSVSELEKLTGDWNSVVDANLATQHLHVALEAVRAAIAAQDQPSPFITELAALKEISNGNAVVSAAIGSIPPTAYQRGIPTPANLIDRYRRVASEVRKAALLPEDAGIASHAASAVLSRFMFSKRGAGLPEGEDVEAVLTRTEVWLEEGDLDGAAREMNGLKGWAGVLSRDWVSECRRVLETRQALDVIATEARLQSLLVD